jgi:hypothetical protein
MNTLENMIHKFSNIENTPDPVVNKARESLNWKCQAWRDKLFMHEKSMDIEKQYSACWGKPTHDKLKEIIAKMQHDFNAKFKAEVQAAYTECPSYTSFEITALNAPENQVNYGNFSQPIVFSLKPNSTLTRSEKGLWGTMGVGSSKELHISNASTGSNNDISITTLGF